MNSKGLLIASLILNVVLVAVLIGVWTHFDSKLTTLVADTTAANANFNPRKLWLYSELPYFPGLPRRRRGPDAPEPASPPRAGADLPAPRLPEPVRDRSESPRLDFDLGGAGKGLRISAR